MKWHENYFTVICCAGFCWLVGSTVYFRSFPNVNYFFVFSALILTPTLFASPVRSEFIFVNPNSKGQCGCGESFMTTGSSGSSKP